MKFESSRASAWVSTRVSSRMTEVLALLADALCYAEDLDCGPWEFAVPIGNLHTAGLSDNDLRWLLAKGYVEHAVEVTEVGEASRSFRQARTALFSDRACFVLTTGGRELALGVAGAGAERPEGRNGHAAASLLNSKAPPVEPITVVPTWDRDRQELRWGIVVVKQYKVPSPNQETILAAFEEEHWPPRIDDPLSPHFDQDPKRRLHDTINTLNRNQKSPLIRFLGDGSGQGVRWEPSGRSTVKSGAPPLAPTTAEH